MTRYQRGYDLNGNVTSRRLRDGTSIGFSFDFLDRTIAKDLPGTDPDGAYTYDLLGRLTGATQGTESAAFTYDALGRKLTETGLLGTMQSLWDAAGRRTRLTWPDGTYVDYDHLVTGETSAVRQNGATSGIGVLATYGYDGLGRRTSLTRGNGMATSYAYTGPQLTGLSHDLAGSSFDVAFGFTYNPAGQIVTRTASNTAYAYTAMGSGSLAYGINGLNQTTAVGAATITSDGRGNLTSDGTNSYTFSSENRVTGLITGSITTALGYDPLGRWTKGGASIWLGWDGDDMVIEKLGGAATKWVHGAGGEPLLREDPDGTWHWMYADERGSTLGSTLNDGSSEWITIYDEYGRTAPGHGAFRHGYAGQVLIGSGLSFARNRVYSLNLGRFLQTDPVGYGAGMNMYNYVGSDPINYKDFLGLAKGAGLDWDKLLDDLRDALDAAEDAIIVNAYRGGSFITTTGPVSISYDDPQGKEIIVYGYKNRTFVDAKVIAVPDCSGNVRFIPTVYPDRGMLAFIAHPHEVNAPPNQATYAYPGELDGVVPATVRVTNYVLSPSDIFAIRPGPSRGTVVVDHIFGTTSYPASSEQVMRNNAAATASSSAARAEATGSAPNGSANLCH